MNRNAVKKSGVCRILNLALAGVIVTATLTFAAKTAVPLILFSGQSNMVCLGAANNELPIVADRTKLYENIKIHNRSDAASSKWSTLKPGFGGDAQHFGPELYFGKILMDSMPNTKFAFIKDATSGTYIEDPADKTKGWLPPSSNNGTGGKLFVSMMTHIDNALKEFKDAYDTALYEPKWAGFVWLQGEFDGMNQTSANHYEVNLTNLIKDIRAKAKADSMPVVIPMICQTTSPSMKWTYIDIIHAAEIAVTVKLKKCDTTQLKDYKYVSDNVHFNAASMATIGTNCAQRWLKMKYINNTVPVIYQEKKSSANISALRNASENTAIFNLTGRQIGNSVSNVNSSNISSGSVIYNSKIITNVNTSINK
ncbi:MAG: sialate O-acetylesterase [Fibrobacter sp.]|nr:sialate O-acetylesterase [Fibrobacter sp.]